MGLIPSTPKNPGPRGFPKPLKLFTRIKSEDNKNDIIDYFDNLTRFVKIIESLSTFVGHSWQFINFFNAFKDLIEALDTNASDSIEKMKELIKKEIKTQVFKSKLTSIKSKIQVIASRIAELAKTSNSTNAIIAISACEEILCEFDNDDNLWNACLLSSPVLIPFAALCVKIIEVNDQNGYSSKVLCSKLKKQLNCLLSDYKKHTVLTRLNFVKIEIINNCMGHVIISESYQLSHEKLSNPNGDWTINGKDWQVFYPGQDEWQGWKDCARSYNEVFEYRKNLIQLYEADFDSIINLISTRLSKISLEDNNYQPKKRDFPKASFSREEAEISTFFDSNKF